MPGDRVVLSGGSGFLGQWLKDRAYYRLELIQRGVDNPDQRISEDLRLFVDNTLDLGIGLLSSLVTLVTFTVILWELSGDYTIAGLRIPGFMFWTVLAYSLIGSFVVHLIGKPLISLGFNQQRFEAELVGHHAYAQAAQLGRIVPVSVFCAIPLHHRCAALLRG